MAANKIPPQTQLSNWFAPTDRRTPPAGGAGGLLMLGKPIDFQQYIKHKSTWEPEERNYLQVIQPQPEVSQIRTTAFIYLDSASPHPPPAGLSDEF